MSVAPVNFGTGKAALLRYCPDALSVELLTSFLTDCAHIPCAAIEPAEQAGYHSPTLLGLGGAGKNVFVPVDRLNEARDLLASFESGGFDSEDEFDETGVGLCQ